MPEKKLEDIVVMNEPQKFSEEDVEEIAIQVREQSKKSGFVKGIIAIVIGLAIVLFIAPTGQYTLFGTSFGQLESIALFAGIMLILFGLNEIFQFMSMLRGGQQ